MCLPSSPRKKTLLCDLSIYMGSYINTGAVVRVGHSEEFYPNRSAQKDRYIQMSLLKY